MNFIKEEIDPFDIESKYHVYVGSIDAKVKSEEIQDDVSIKEEFPSFVEDFNGENFKVHSADESEVDPLASVSSFEAAYRSGTNSFSIVHRKISRVLPIENIADVPSKSDDLQKSLDDEIDLSNVDPLASVSSFEAAYGSGTNGFSIVHRKMSRVLPIKNFADGPSKSDDLLKNLDDEIYLKNANVLSFEATNECDKSGVSIENKNSSRLLPIGEIADGPSENDDSPQMSRKKKRKDDEL